MSKNKKEKSKPIIEKKQFKLEIKKIEQVIKSYKSERKTSWMEFKKLMKLEMNKLKSGLKKLEFNAEKI